MSLSLGTQLMSAIEATAAALQERTGVECTVGPVDSLSRGTQLMLRPERPTVEKSRPSPRRPDRQAYRVAYDCILRLRGKGGLNPGFRAEVAQAHLLTNIALDEAFEVDVTDAVPDANIPDGAPEGEISGSTVTVDAEGEGAGEFFQPSPQADDYLYRKDWLVTVRFGRDVTEGEVQALIESEADELSVDI